VALLPIPVKAAVCHFFKFDFGDSIRYKGKRTEKSEAVSPLVAPTWATEATATLARHHPVLQPPPAAPPPERATGAYATHGDGGGGLLPSISGGSKQTWPIRLPEVPRQRGLPPTAAVVAVTGSGAASVGSSGCAWWCMGRMATGAEWRQRRLWLVRTAPEAATVGASRRWFRRPEFLGARGCRWWLQVVAGWSWPWPTMAGWCWLAAVVASRGWLWPALSACGCVLASHDRLMAWLWPARACGQQALWQDGGAPPRRRRWSDITLLVGSRLSGACWWCRRGISGCVGLFWLRCRDCSGLLSLVEGVRQEW
jgi:hypothetical protein